MLRNEIEILAAVKLTELQEETLLKLAEAGELKARRAGGTVYFEVECLERLVERMVADARNEVAS
jgi:hypothetical protein